MRITIDLDRGKVVGTGTNTELTSLSMKRTAAAVLEVQFVRNFAVVELSNVATGIFELKTKLAYDTLPVAGALAWVKTGSGATTLYTFTLGLSNPQIDLLLGINPAPVAFTAVAATDLLSTAAPHGLVADARVGDFASTTTLPGGLSAVPVYFVLAAGLTTTDFKVSLTSGGTPIDITSTGTGTHSFVRILPDVVSTPLMAALQWIDGGKKSETQTLDFTLVNNVVRDGDVVPAMPPIAYGIFLPGITALTGDPIAFTAATSDLITSTAHGRAVGDRIRVSSTGTLPAGLSAHTDYFLIASGFTVDAFKVSLTLGGSVVDITTTGSGTHSWKRLGEDPITHLDAIPTVALQRGYIIQLFIGDSWYVYVLKTGPTATLGDIEPLDYHAVDNDCHWSGAILTGPIGVNGFEFVYSTSGVDDDPGAGHVRFHNGAGSGVLSTAIRCNLSHTDNDGNYISAFLNELTNFSTIRGNMIMRKVADPIASAAMWKITGAANNDPWRGLIIPTNVFLNGTFANGDLVRIEFLITGDKGDGVPVGGTAGQGLTKVNATDYNTQWVTLAAGDVVGPASVTDDLPAIFNGATGKLIKSKTYAAFKTLLALVKGDVGLGSVTNDAQLKAADLDTDGTMAANSASKVPAQSAVVTYVAAAVAAIRNGVSSAFDTLAEIATELGLKAPLASPALTGTPTAPTAAFATSTTQLATCAFVIANAGGGGSAWGGIVGTLSDQTDLQSALNLKATLASPALTGTPTAPTASLGTNTTQVATTAFVLANASSGAAVGPNPYDNPPFL